MTFTWNENRPRKQNSRQIPAYKSLLSQTAHGSPEIRQLGQARVALATFTAAWTELWLGEAAETALATHPGFGYCCRALAQHRSLHLPPTAPQQVRQGHKSSTADQDWPDRCSVAHTATLCGRTGEGGEEQGADLSLPIHPEPSTAKSVPDDSLSVKAKPHEAGMGSWLQGLWSNICQLCCLQCREHTLFQPTGGDLLSHKDL